jgi:glycerol-3-phosphate O-acyltransferase
MAEVNQRLDLRLPEFKTIRRQNLINRLVYDAQVLRAAKEHCQESGISEELGIQKVERYAREIVPAFNAYLYFRFGSWLSRAFSKLLYRVRVGFVDEEGFRKVDPYSSVVFIMNHRSNMDYILLAHLAMKRVALSFAVGEWARAWPVRPLVKAFGAFFVRRDSGNVLYRRVLERFVQMATEAGVVQAVFPEGKLSRNGLIGRPKIGLLDYMLRGFDPERGRDLVFIPVGINYDRVLEDRTLLVKSDRRVPKKSTLGVVKTTLLFILRNIWLMLRGEWYRYGYAVVNFGSPLSMREYVRTHHLDFREMDNEKRIDTVKQLAQELMNAVGQVVPVVPVPLISSVFVGDHEKALTEKEIKTKTQSLMSDLRRNVYVPRRNPEYVIEVGLRMLVLRHFVREEKAMYYPVPEEKKILDYYANTITHLLV